MDRQNPRRRTGSARRFGTRRRHRPGQGRFDVSDRAGRPSGSPPAGPPLVSVRHDLRAATPRHAGNPLDDQPDRCRAYVPRAASRDPADRAGRRFAGRAVTARADRDLRRSSPRCTTEADVCSLSMRATRGEPWRVNSSPPGAQRRGLAALVVSGRTRDTATVAKLAIPVWSSGFAPNAYAATAEPVANPVLDMGASAWRQRPDVGDDDGLVGDRPGVRGNASAGARDRGPRVRCAGRSRVAPPSSTTSHDPLRAAPSGAAGCSRGLLALAGRPGSRPSPAAADPDPTLFPIERLHKITTTCSRRRMLPALQYTASDSTPELRALVAGDSPRT